MKLQKRGIIIFKSKIIFSILILSTCICFTSSCYSEITPQVSIITQTVIDNIEIPKRDMEAEKE